jgi:hypothetical protein
VRCLGAVWVVSRVGWEVERWCEDGRMRCVGHTKDGANCRCPASQKKLRVSRDEKKKELSLASS